METLHGSERFEIFSGAVQKSSVTANRKLPELDMEHRVVVQPLMKNLSLSKRLSVG